MPAKGAINPKTGKRYEWEVEQAAKKAADLTEINQKIGLLKRQQKAIAARTAFMPFIKFTSPDNEDPNDVEKSRYKDAKHHRSVARVLEAIINGEVDYTFVILTMPPRHGKSEQVSRRLPAWLIGRFPEQHGVVATYNDDFAADFGKDVRSIIKTPQFKQVFPNSHLVRGGAASDKLITTAGGKWAFVGRGGSLTGQGAHCFPAGTMVETSIGSVPIEQLTVSHKVLSYDIGNKRLVWKAVEAVARRPRSRLYRITTSSGRVVEATSDHRFYANGEWIEADKLTAGDCLLCAMRGAVVENGVRHYQTSYTRARELLLLDGVLEPGDERTETRVSRVSALREPCSAQEVVRRREFGQHLLLERVPESGESRTVRSPGGVTDETVREMQRDVHAVELGVEVLQPSVREPSACGAYGAERQSAVEGRSVGQPREAACDATVSGVAPVGHETGRAEVRPLRRDRTAGGAPHRREPDEQSGVEPRNVVPTVSREGAFFFGEGDFVATVEDTRRDADVYDIQVEETECFFANGVLAHNCLILDDLIKDAKEAASQAIRDQAWDWFTKVAMTRRMGRKIVIMTFTRWHADDPIGRLTDPENPYFNPVLAKKIKIINIPAIAEEDDPLGREPGEPLWPDGPDKFDLEFLEEQRALDPLGFAALYQQRPSLLDGDLFKRETVNFYGPGTAVRLPDELRIYCASDHAVATGQRNDPTVLLKVGVDSNQNIYLLECVWKKMPSDIATEAMLAMARGNMRPLIWWAEKGHISKSIGPFLRKRMVETNTFINIREVTPATDKAQRAQSIAARVAMGKVFFPKDAFWTEKAINQMMAFPNGAHDDFVDALAYIGLGLQSQFAAVKSSAKKAIEKPEFGTLDWVKLADKWKREQMAIADAGGF